MFYQNTFVGGISKFQVFLPFLGDLILVISAKNSIKFKSKGGENDESK